MSENFKKPVTLTWRKMSIPDETALLGVETDRNSERVEFQLPRYYQGFDMSSKDWYVDTMNEQGELYDVALMDSQLVGDTEDTLSLVWVVGAIPASVDGTVHVRLRATDGSFVWQSETGRFRLAETFATGSPSDAPGMSYFQEVTLQCQMASADAQAAAAEALAAAAAAAKRRFPDPLAKYETLEALQEAHPTGETGDCYVIEEAGSTRFYFWDLEAEAWAFAGTLAGEITVDVRADQVLRADGSERTVEDGLSHCEEALREQSDTLNAHGVELGDAWDALAGKANVGHAPQHFLGGADAITPANIGALATADVVNNLTTTASGKALDARQGKVLKDTKAALVHAPQHFLGGADAITPANIGALATADVVSNLTTTASGKALDARQGKALNDAIATKVSKTGDVMTGHLNIGTPEETGFKVVGVRRTVNGVAGQARLGVGETTTNPGVALELVIDGKAVNGLYVRDTYATLGKPLNVTGGGTNANNPTDARNNLGLKSGAISEIQHGKVEISMPAGGTGSVAIKFVPAFSGTPSVTANLQNASPSSKSPVLVSSVSATGATLYMSWTGTSATPFDIHWIAVK